MGGTPGAALRRFLSPKSTPPLACIPSVRATVPSVLPIPSPLRSLLHSVDSVRPRLASYPAAPPHPVCLCFVFSVRLIFMSDPHNSAEPVSGALNWYLLMLCHVLAPAHVSSLGASPCASFVHSALPNLPWTRHGKKMPAAPYAWVCYSRSAALMLCSRRLLVAFLLQLRLHLQIPGYSTPLHQQVYFRALRVGRHGLLLHWSLAIRAIALRQRDAGRKTATLPVFVLSVLGLGALAGARDGRPSARARALPRPLPVLANLHRSRPARPRLASGAIGAAPHSSNRGPANKAQGVAGGPPPLRARAGSGPPPLPPRSSHPREGHGHARSRSARRTRDAMAAPSNPGLAPKMAARPPNGGPAPRTTDTPKRPAPLTVFRSTSGTAAVPEGKTKQKRAKPGTSSNNPASPAAVQIAASPRLRLPAGLHIVGLPRRPNLSQLEALLSHVAGLSPSLAGLEPSFQLEQTRRSSRKIPAFFLSHAAFAIPGLADRILEELLPAAGKDKRGRTKLASPIGTLKISLAQQSATTALPPPPDDRNGGLTPSNTASSCPDTEPHPSDGSGPAAFQGLRLVQFTAGDSEDGWTCVCCRGDILACDKLARLECLHVVHSDCLERWVKAPHSRGRCPECNAPVL